MVGAHEVRPTSFPLPSHSDLAEMAYVPAMKWNDLFIALSLIMVAAFLFVLFH